jgi:hypothetical protein
MKNIEPTVVIPIPTPINVGNPYSKVLAADNPPRIKHIIPAIVLKAKAKPRISKLLLEEIA